MKKVKSIILVLMISLFVSGCGTMKGYNVYENVYATYSKMKSYKAEVEVTSYSNNSQNKYTLTQFYKAPDKHRTEYTIGSGGKNIAVINGIEGRLFSDYGAEEVLLNTVDIDEKNYLMLNTFFEIYYASEETSVKTSGNEKRGSITLKAETGDSNPYRKNMELVIDSKTMKPKKMTIFGYDGKPTLKIEYLKFDINAELSDDVFGKVQNT